jgi:hypothetical protein
MPTPNFDTQLDATSIEQVLDYIINNNKLMNYMLANLDNQNIVNVAGFLATATVFQSKNGMVGLSSADPGNPNAIRIWAGATDPTQAPFRVQENGFMYSTEGFIGGWDIGPTMLSGTGIIQGGVLRTAAPGNTRIELSGGVLAGYYSDNQYHGLVFNPGATINTFDLYIYHDGVQLIEFYDDGGSMKLRPGSGTSFWTLGKQTGTTYCDGQWTFLNTASVDLGPNTAQGKVQYAGQADSALSASSAQSVDWSNVTNHPDGTAAPQMNGTASAGTSALYSRQDHVHPTDTTRAPLSSPTFTGSPKSPTPSTSDNSTNIATTAYVQAQGFAQVLSGGKKIESGSGSIAVTANVEGAASVFFSASFGSSPLVMVFLTGTNTSGGFKNTTIASTGSSTVGFNISANSPVSQTLQYGWIAIGS